MAASIRVLFRSTIYFQGEYMDTQEKNQTGSYGKQFVMSPNNVILKYHFPTSIPFK